MPFTPFHMGPGLAFKAAGGRHFSLLVFGVSQVAMDIEPLVHILRGDAVVHGFAHTYAGATLVALVSLVVGRPIAQALLNLWTPDPQSPFLLRLRGPGRISWRTAAVSAFVGTYSHVFLDSLMHRDLRPLAPFSDTNALLRAIPVDALHLLCVGSGVAGALVILLAAALPPRRGS